MWARVNREKRHAKRSSSDADGLGRIGDEGGGDEEVRVGGDGIITVTTTLCTDVSIYVANIRYWI